MIGGGQPMVLATWGLRPGLLQCLAHVLWAEDKKSESHFKTSPFFLCQLLLPSSTSHEVLSRDMCFFDSHRGLFALILPYFAFILPFYFPFSLVLSPLPFSITFSPFSLRLFIFFPPNDIGWYPPGGLGGYFPIYSFLYLEMGLPSYLEIVIKLCTRTSDLPTYLEMVSRLCTRTPNLSKAATAPCSLSNSTTQSVTYQEGTLSHVPLVFIEVPKETGIIYFQMLNRPKLYRGFTIWRTFWQLCCTYGGKSIRKPKSW